MEEFIAGFAGVTDPRQDNTRHDLHELLLIALCTRLCGGEDCSDMALFGAAKEPFLRRFLRLRHGVPRHDRKIPSLGNSGTASGADGPGWFA